jgi:hypothetical protein
MKIISKLRRYLNLPEHKTPNPETDTPDIYRVKPEPGAKEKQSAEE